MKKGFKIKFDLCSLNCNFSVRKKKKVLRFKHSKNEEYDEEKDVGCKYCNLVDVSFLFRRHDELLCEEKNYTF